MTHFSKEKSLITLQSASSLFAVGCVWEMHKLVMLMLIHFQFLWVKSRKLEERSRLCNSRGRKGIADDSDQNPASGPKTSTIPSAQFIQKCALLQIPIFGLSSVQFLSRFASVRIMWFLVFSCKKLKDDQIKQPQMLRFNSADAANVFPLVVQLKVLIQWVVHLWYQGTTKKGWLLV